MGVDAERSSKTSFVLSLATQAILTIILWPCKDLLGALFSSDEEVSRLVAQLIPVSCAFMLGDAWQATAAGVLRGLGRQKLVLWLNVLGFWVIGVPIGAILTFAVSGLGVFGLWWGFVAGIYSSGLVSLWYLSRVDWTKESRRTVKRLSSIGASTKRINTRNDFPNNAEDNTSGGDLNSLAEDTV